MVEIKTGELIGAALDWAVAKVERVTVKREYSGNDGDGNCVTWLSYSSRYGEFDYSPSTEWSRGGPLIENHMAMLCYPTEAGDHWEASLPGDTDWHFGPTPLIAACRAIVAAKLGDTVQVPAELLTNG